MIWPAGHKVDIGEAIGVVAAQSIGEPGTQLTMRTFHIGGAASRSAAVSNVEVKNDGSVRMHNLKRVKNSDGKYVAVSRSGEIAIQDKHGRERERYKVVYGAVIEVDDGDKVSGGQIIANWDPHTHPVITEVAGVVRFTEIIEGATVEEAIDDVTGLSRIVVLDPKQRQPTAKDMTPKVMLVDEAEQPLNLAGTEIPAQYPLPAGAIITVEDGASVGVGDVIARLPQGIHQDPRHHRWSSTSGGPVRSAQAKGGGGAGRILWHSKLRQGDQGQTACGDNRCRRRDP